MNDLGFFVYLPKYLPAPELLIEDLHKLGAKWLSFKVSDGPRIYNSGIGPLIAALQAAGFSVGGWSYTYPDGGQAQADRISERIETLHLEHLFLDVEKEWKHLALQGAIDTLLNGIKIGSNYPLGFCSYRYPDLHPPIDYARFLGDPKMQLNVPQVYWLGAHDPADQVLASYQQYLKYPAQPFIPIGSTFPWSDWMPTAQDLRSFISVCHEMALPAYGFYSLDSMYRNNWRDLFDAIAGWKPLPPSELPDKVQVRTTARLRNAPSLDDSTKMGAVYAGVDIDVTGMVDDFYIVQGFIHKSMIKEDVMIESAAVIEFRVGHDKEKGVIWRKNVPEVYHFDQMAPTILTKAWQYFIYELNRGGLPGGMTPNSFHGLLKWNKGFSNRTAGFDFPGLPRADHVKGTNLNSKLPWLDKCRVCGDAILHGRLNGDLLTIETLDGSKPPPPVKWVLEHPWLIFRCYTVLPNGSNAEFPQTTNGVLMPLVATGSVTVRINKNIPRKPYPLVKRIYR